MKHQKADAVAQLFVLTSQVARRKGEGRGSREGKKSSKRRTRSPPGVCGCWCAVPFAVSFGFDARSPIVFVKSKSKRECCWTEERRRKKKRKRLWKRVFFDDDDDDNRLFRALKNGHFLFACFFLCSLFSPSSITLSEERRRRYDSKGSLHRYKTHFVYAVRKR